jgi:hypothetical protein
VNQTGNYVKETLHTMRPLQMLGDEDQNLENKGRLKHNRHLTQVRPSSPGWHRQAISQKWLSAFRVVHAFVASVIGALGFIDRQRQDREQLRSPGMARCTETWGTSL